MRLNGKIAVITGAGSGIGRATATRFAAEGGLIETLGPGDVIAIPCWHEHAVDAPQDTIIFRVSDEPLLAKLGLARSATH